MLCTVPTFEQRLWFVERHVACWDLLKGTTYSSSPGTDLRNSLKPQPIADDTSPVTWHYIKIRSHTWMESNGRVVGMKPSLCVATIRQEFKPQGRSRGVIPRTRWEVSTTHGGDLCTGTWRAVIYLQQIITTFRVKLVKHQLNAVATGHRDTPAASLAVRITVGVPRTCDASVDTSIFGRGTSCKNIYVALMQWR